MNVFEKLAVGAGLIVVGVTAAYRYVLTDEQREAVREAGAVVQNSFNEVADSVSPLVSGGPTRAEEEAARTANRERTANQWATLGY